MYFMICELLRGSIHTIRGKRRKWYIAHFSQKWTITIFACFGATTHSWEKKNVFQFNNLIKLTGISHASLGLKVLYTFIFMHIYLCIICLLYIKFV